MGDNGTAITGVQPRGWEPLERRIGRFTLQIGDLTEIPQDFNCGWSGVGRGDLERDRDSGAGTRPAGFIHFVEALDNQRRSVSCQLSDLVPLGFVGQRFRKSLD